MDVLVSEGRAPLFVKVLIFFDIIIGSGENAAAGFINIGACFVMAYLHSRFVSCDLFGDDVNLYAFLVF